MIGLHVVSFETNVKRSKSVTQLYRLLMNPGYAFSVVRNLVTVKLDRCLNSLKKYQIIKPKLNGSLGW